MKLHVPKKVEEIINRLEENGFEAYAVGGCVRDSILQRVPDDWDITTSAKPSEVKALFLHTIDTGIQHGTVTVMIGKEGYEVTTFRVDGEYSDGRHPDKVDFSSSLTEDLKRRDFTINAMAYSESKGLVDEFEGISDLEKKRIRCVGDPFERFSEDALRMLRAIRFAGQLGFEIEEETFRAIGKLAPTIQKVSAERIAKELEKLLLSTEVEKFRLIYSSGILEQILPNLYHYFEADKTRLEKRIKRLKKAEYEEKKGLHILRWSLLLEELGEEEAGRVLKSLKLDNETIATVKKIVEYRGLSEETSREEMRVTVNKLGKNLIPLFFAFREAKGMETGREFFEEILKNRECTEISGLEIDGNQLMELGVPKGKEVGECLKWLLTLVLHEPEKNMREKLILEVKNHEKYKVDTDIAHFIDGGSGSLERDKSCFEPKE